jgi:hypothetical protein
MVLRSVLPVALARYISGYSLGEIAAREEAAVERHRKNGCASASLR